MATIGWLLLLTLAACVSTDDSGVGNDNVSRRLAELERLLHAQQEHIQEQDAEIASLKHQDRRLETTTLDKAVADIQGGMNHIWLILCGALVMLMQAGFSLLEAGCCRSKNVQNILLKNLADVCVGTLAWWSLGFGFAYGNPDDDGDGYLDGGFIGHKHFFGHEFVSMKDGVIVPAGGKMKDWFFQWAFCSAAATIVSGGIAERVQFPGYLVFSFLMTAFIYPVVVAWTWGYGWLADINAVGYMDFAGSGIVHMTGGVGALVGAICAGPRDGRFENPNAFVPHSLPLVVEGTFILWFGWYGFNCGSTLGLPDTSKGELAAQVAMNTTIAAATGGLVVFVLRIILLKGLYDVGGFCNGILAGLVSITAPCGNVHSWQAFWIAIIGAFIYQGSSLLLKKLKIDDPLDAFPVHGACGAWGVLAAALFDWGSWFKHVNGWSGFSCKTEEDGSCMEGNVWAKLFEANLMEIFMITVWVGGLSLIIFLPLRVVGLLRADSNHQFLGMDEAKHSPSKAYSIDEKQENTASRVSALFVPAPAPVPLAVADQDQEAQEEEEELAEGTEQVGGGVFDDLVTTGQAF